MNARLKVIHQKSNVKTIKLQPTTTIGRSSECDLKIASNLVSRVHCRITVNDQAVTVEDLESANGTFVDGEALAPNQPTPVNPGAKLVIGPAEFIVEYVTETSNTIVVKRSSEGSRPALEELRNFMSSGDSGLLLSTSGKSPETAGPGSSPSKPRPSPAPQKPIEATRPVPSALHEKGGQAPLPAQRPATSPKPIVAEQPLVERPTPLVQKPPMESPAPKAAAKVPNVPVASPPVAKVVSVMTTPVEAPAAPRHPEPIQPKPDVISQPAAAVSPPKVAVPEPPVVTTQQPFGFVEFEEVVSESDQTTQFNFNEATDYRPPSKPAAKEKKEKPLKSLFSMFGGKPKAAKPTSTNSEPNEPTAVPEPEAANIVQEEPTELPFGAPEVPPESAKESSDNQLDDDFQNFLRQF